MTPREYRMAAAGAARRAQDTQIAALVTGWHTAAFVASASVGKLQDIGPIIARLRQSPERLSAAAQRTQVGMLSERLGVRMVPISDAAKRALVKLKKHDGK